IYWQQLSDNSRTKLLKHLRLLILGGEILPLQLAKKTCEQFPDLTCLNAYGPTEAVITTTIYPLPILKVLEKFYSTPIGKPIAHRRIYILDANHQPLPINTPGELCIAGESLARGYINRPELTADKFIEVEIFGQRQRIYKTGDRARWLPDGNLEFLGRIDHQVKLRGFRIELGEIEAALSRHETIKDAVVVLNEREGNKMLAAYLTPQQPIEIKILRDFLKTRLPDYMIPTSFTVLKKLPLSPNGKINRKALPEPDAIKMDNSTALSTLSESLLATLWSTVLKIDIDSSKAHFFELGGHSLLATKLVSRIRDSFAVDVPLRRLFEYPVLSDMAAWLDQQQPGDCLPPIVPQSDDQPRLMSYHQERILFLGQLNGPAATYNMPATLKLTGKLDFVALKQTFILLVERHQSLRLAFDIINNQPRLQEIPGYNPITEIDLRLLPKEQQQTEIEHLAQNHASKPFVLGKRQLIQLQLLRLNDQENLLLVNMHHIIA
ncbi:AMP-binding protein, partial [bacterium]|nr:AMP-binding protein [bacterium]